MSRKKTRLQSVTEAAQIHRDACGIDISPEVIYVAVGPQQDAPAVRRLECLRQSCTGPRLVESVRGPNAHALAERNRLRSGPTSATNVCTVPTLMLGTAVGDQRGKILSSRTRKMDHRLAAALRMAAESLCRDKSYLGQYYRRMRARLGGPQAITAAAQARADHLPPGHHRRGIQRRTLRAHRSQEWREIPAAVGATGSHKLGFTLVPVTRTVAEGVS